MLRKPDLHRILTDSNAEQFYLHYEQLTKIKIGFYGLKICAAGKEQLWMPACHHVSHAYARAFNVKVIDGEKVFLTKSKTWFFGRVITGKVSRYAHSWNVIKLAHNKRLILDIIPDETCSMVPIILEYPHPAYTEPRDGVAQRCVSKLIGPPEEQRKIDLLAQEFKRIVG